MNSPSTSRKPKVVAIVAAFNEGPRIRQVIEVLLSYPRFDEVVVVDDGSTDDTFMEALRCRPPYPNKCNMTIITRKDNRGKAASMQEGVDISNPDVIFFADADIVGLNHQIIDSLLLPVVEGRMNMKIAMRQRWVYSIPFVIEAVAHLGGERAVTRQLWDEVPERFKKKFMIETALNHYARHSGGYGYEVFNELTQIIKETKHGLIRGFFARLLMIFDVVKANLLLRSAR